MNREHKKKTFEKGYYKTHPCNDTFICKFCGKTVVPTGAGSNHRNHCPYCLSSQHLGNEPGDRSADCGGIMEPVSVWVRKKQRMGDHSSVQDMRNAQLKPHRR